LSNGTLRKDATSGANIVIRVIRVAQEVRKCLCPR
jgi:hypothetical protein